MERISPGPTRWPPGAERRLGPAKSNLKPPTCDTSGMFVFLHAWWHSWLLCCVLLRVVTLLCVMLCSVGILTGCVVLCGCMSWCVVPRLVATRGVMPFCVASFCALWVFWFVVSCSFPVALCSAVPRGVASRCVLARLAGVRHVGWCHFVGPGPCGVPALLGCVLL